MEVFIEMEYDFYVLNINELENNICLRNFANTKAVMKIQLLKYWL